ncbi:hypothetical protein PFISCL1PPCAC_6233, partial [Pristionchus fissidentatus]
VERWQRTIAVRFRLYYGRDDATEWTDRVCPLRPLDIAHYRVGPLLAALTGEYSNLISLGRITTDDVIGGLETHRFRVVVDTVALNSRPEVPQFLFDCASRSVQVGDVKRSRHLLPKEISSLCSPYLHSLFYGNFTDRHSDSIPLSLVDNISDIYVCTALSLVIIRPTMYLFHYSITNIHGWIVGLFDWRFLPKHLLELLCISDRLSFETLYKKLVELAVKIASFEINSIDLAVEFTEITRSTGVLTQHVSRYPIVSDLETMKGASSSAYAVIFDQAISHVEEHRPRRYKLTFSFEAGKIECEIFNEIGSVWSACYDFWGYLPLDSVDTVTDVDGIEGIPFAGATSFQNDDCADGIYFENLLFHEESNWLLVRDNGFLRFVEVKERDNAYNVIGVVLMGIEHIRTPAKMDLHFSVI